MDLYSFPPLAAALNAVASTLAALTAALEPALGGLAAAASVLLITVVVRTALIPAGVAQARADRARARLAPRLRELQRRHRNDRERLQRETLKLYRDENVSPTAGCLPLLVQAPVVALLYGVFIHPTIAGHANGLLAETLLGVPLGSSLAGTIASGALPLAAALVFGAVIASIALVGELTRRAFRVTDAPAALSGVLGVAQFATAVIAVFVPLAAGLYLVVTVAWTLGQRLILRRILPPVAA
ncbi:YidC/Oxa1 family membrane protein insertase [Microbacterium sp. Yaish 1]|uniref:YidC/Oxa1 family membrane protein insertase n=1 Tax=Microbacterium sp. Yaish 1 TaxID=2025014 RepID=UPI000B940E23|nr:membrane protein insertase YidC [Microbacterium sp. Yaish 1]OYC95984.1 preprotein translocase YidC [Microbacterium sp. Yaish 1]